MRKLFRMKYESCNGQCYSYDDVMKIHNLGLDVQGSAAFLDRLLAIHRPSCGNAEIAFSLDLDEQTEVFVASMQRYGALDLYAGRTALDAMNQLIDGALAWYASDEGKAKMAAQPGAGHDVCRHGDDKALVEFAITHSGLSHADQAGLRAQFAG